MYASGGTYLRRHRTWSFPDKAQASGKLCDKINVKYHSEIPQKTGEDAARPCSGCCLWIQSADRSHGLGSRGHGALGTGHGSVLWAWLLLGQHRQPVRALHFMGLTRCCFCFLGSYGEDVFEMPVFFRSRCLSFKLSRFCYCHRGTQESIGGI